MPLCGGPSKAVALPPKEPRKRTKSSGYGRIEKKMNDSTPSSRASTPSTRASSRSSSSAPSATSSRASSRASSPKSSVVPLPPINSDTLGRRLAREKSMTSNSVFLGAATPRYMDFLDAASLPPTPLPSHSVFLGLKLQTPKPNTNLLGAASFQLEEACVKVNAERAKKRDTSKPPAKQKALEKKRRQLEKACLDGDVETAKKCRLPRAMLSEKLSSGEVPLHHAVKHHHFNFVEFLIQHGIDINMEDEKGRTALQIAAANNDEKAMCRLVELGAEVKAQDNLGLVWLKSSS